MKNMSVNNHSNSSSVSSASSVSRRSFLKGGVAMAAMLAFPALIPDSMAMVASAASVWPNLSTSSYCEFKAVKTIYCYRNSGCTTRGSASPAKSYSAYIASGDVCYIYSINSSYAYVSYPTSSGRKLAYIKRSDLFNVSAPEIQATARAATTTYTGAGVSYGSIAVNDTLFRCGTYNGRYAVIYPARSGSRAYKLGYISTAAWGTITAAAVSTGSSSSVLGNAKVVQFINDSRWKVGTPFSNSVTGKLDATRNMGWGCNAYARDFAMYVYGKALTAGTKYTSVSEIRAGDCLYVTPQHWMVVLARSGNTLDIIHGNWTSGNVCRGNFTISGNMIGNSKTFSYGYHY